jgi:carbamoyl-phosphate synthase large subunit
MPVRKNILLLSAGRRVSLARALRKVADDHDAQLYTADMRPEMSSACRDQGLFVALPAVVDPDYPAALASLCERLYIGLVIPTIDTELRVLAALRDSFMAAGTTIIVCDNDLIAIARDKRRTAEFFATFGVHSPELYPIDTPRFPAIAKPSDGSLSRDITILHKSEDFTENVRATENLMLAEYIDPAKHDEFTCDAYYDRSGALRCVVPRQRIEVRGGEVAKGRTAKNNIVDMFRSKLGQIQGARGCLTFQFFRHGDTEELYLIELNARFGGGFPLSHAAGADYPRWLYEEWITGNSIEDFDDWEDGLTMLRYDDAVFVSAKNGHV